MLSEFSTYETRPLQAGNLRPSPSAGRGKVRSQFSGSAIEKKRIPVFRAIFGIERSANCCAISARRSNSKCFSLSRSCCPQSQTKPLDVCVADPSLSPFRGERCINKFRGKVYPFQLMAPPPRYNRLNLKRSSPNNGSLREFARA